MLVQTTLFGGLLMASQCLAGNLHEGPILKRRSFDIEDMLRHHARGVVDHIDKRQSAAAPTTTPASGTPNSVNMAQWERDTEIACEKALVSLNGQASNPTGMAVCYNLPFLDNSTGVFEAEVRLYNISAPIDPWVGVKLADISMTLSYLGATVQMMNTTGLTRRDSTVSWPPIRAREEGELVQRQAASATTTAVSVPKPSNELKVLMYVGKLNSNVMGTAMSNAQVQQLLVPTIELDAQSPSTKQPVKAVLSSTEASFVNGVFAKAVASSTADSAAAAASASDLAATAAPVKVPGLSLGVPPIGLTVTLVWTVLFMGAVGLGTVGRIQFRDQYRRRVKTDQAKSISTF